MCQYSSEDGFATDWHLVHLGSRAVGGAAAGAHRGDRGHRRRAHLARTISASGSDAHVEMLARIARFVSAQGAVPGMQLAHAGRKASTRRAVARAAVRCAVADGGWTPVVGAERRCRSPTATRCRRRSTRGGIRAIVAAFHRRGAPRARGGLPGDRGARRARLPAARVPLAAVEPPDRRVRGLVRGPDPHSLAEVVAGRAQRVAGERCRCWSRLLRHRLGADGGWDGRAVGRAGRAAAPPTRRRR